jgi:hypothetical protein
VIPTDTRVGETEGALTQFTAPTSPATSLRHPRPLIYSTGFLTFPVTRQIKHTLFPDRIPASHPTDHHGVVHPNVTTLSSSPSCQVRSPDILFPPNALWQQERGLKEDEAEDPEKQNPPDAWMGSFDDEDASRDTTKKARQPFYLIQRFPSMTFCSHKTIANTAPLSFAPRCVDFFVSFARISLGPPEERRRPPHASRKRRSQPRTRAEVVVS